MLAPPKGENLSELFATASPLDPGPSGITDLLGAVLASRPPWMRDALCAEHPEVVWFPGQGDDIRPAKQLCGRCLVKVECRAWALDQGAELDGVWAGTTRKSRREMRRAAAPPRRPPVLAADGRLRPVQLMERLSAFLAGHPDESHSASGLRHVAGRGPSNARALEILAEEGYVAATTGGTIRGRHYPDVQFFRYVATYIDAGAVTVATDPPRSSGATTAA